MAHGLVVCPHCCGLVPLAYYRKTHERRCAEATNYFANRVEEFLYEMIEHGELA
jgi:hypothetical protein